jgi:hypothetical protein
MEQEKHKTRLGYHRRIGCLIPVLAVLFIILTQLACGIPYGITRSFDPPPVVTPAHSAQELWDNPLPTPEWITDVATIYGDLSDFYWGSFLDDYPLCVKLRLDAIWNWDVEYADPWELLHGTTSITVDGTAIAYHEIRISHISHPIGLGCEVDDDGCHILSGEPNHICFDTPPLDPGLHTATIRIENNSGIPYSYEWAFRVK